MSEFDITAAGMVTPVGYQAAPSCAALRVGLDGFRETRFMFDGDWLRGATVDYPDHTRGLPLLLRMATSAVAECSPPEAFATDGDTALFVCLAERERPGRLDGLDASFARGLAAQSAFSHRFGRVECFESGSVGAVDALSLASAEFARGRRYCILVGVDSYIHGPTLTSYAEKRRLVTTKNADGFLPGEASAAVLLTPAAPGALHRIRCVGVGSGIEAATQDSGQPLRADGLTTAIRAALSDARCDYEAVDYRITDLTGEQAGFKEAALALTRTMRVKKEELDIWHPSDCVGRVGAATLPLLLGVALAAAKRRYAPGPGTLCHIGDDAGRRAALLLREYGGPST